MLENRTSHPSTAVQLGAIWLAGVVAFPIAIRFLLISLFSPMLLVCVVALPVGIFAFLYALVTATRGVSALGATTAGRLLWALLVLGGGIAGWVLGIAVNNKVRFAFFGSEAGICVVAGVPFVLTAGLLLRNRWHRVGTFGLVLVLVGASVAVLRHESPAEFEHRLATAGIHRDTAYVVAIPGYPPTQNDLGDGLGSGVFLPEPPAAIPPDRYSPPPGPPTICTAPPQARSRTRNRRASPTASQIGRNQPWRPCAPVGRDYRPCGDERESHSVGSQG